MTFGGGKNTVQVRIVGDASQFKRETKSAEKSSQTLVGTLKKHAGLIKTFLAVQAARAVKDFVFGSVKAFSDLNESINAVEVVFGDAADGVLALGKNAAESVGLANSEFNTLAVGFAAFVDQIAAEKDGDVVATMDELTTRVADFASVMNIDVTEAADKFRSGLAGETEPLRKFGLDLSAAAVNVRGLELGLGDVSGKLSEQEKVLARYSLLMEQTEKTAGDFANTSDDLANRQRILTARFTDAQAEIGEALVPAMEALLGLGENLIPVIGTLGVAFAGLTGTLDVGAEALKNWADKHGKEAKTAEDVTAAIIEETDARRNWVDFLLFGIGPLEAASKALREHLQATELTADEIGEYRVAIKKAGDENLITGKTVEILNGVLNDLQGRLGNEVLKATQEVRDAVLDGLDPALIDLRDTTEEATEEAEALAEAEEDQAEALDEAAKAVKRKRDALLEVHNPLFRITQLSRDLEEAEQAVIDAENEFTRDSSEFVTAVMDRADVLFDLRNTFDELVAEGINPTGEAARNMFRGLGVPDDVIDKIFGVFDEIQTNLRDRLFSIDVRANFLGLDSVTRRVSNQNPIVHTHHTGGRINAPRGQEVLVRALGGETFSNPAHGGNGGGDTFIIQGFVGSEAQLAAEMDRLLTRRSRTSQLGFT